MADNHPSPSGPGAPLSATILSREEVEQIVSGAVFCRFGGKFVITLDKEIGESLFASHEALRAALAAAEAEQQRLREVLDEAQTRISAFVDQFDAVVPHMAGMALMSQIHGVPYAGPQMDIEPLRELLKGDQ